MPVQHKYPPKHLALAIALALGCADFVLAQQPTAEPAPPSAKTPQALIKELDAFIKAPSTRTTQIKAKADWNTLQQDEADDFVRVLARENFDGIADGGGGANVIQLDATKGGTLGESQNFQRLDVKKGGWTLTGSGDFSTGALVRKNAVLTNEGSIAGGALIQGTLFNINRIEGDVVALPGGILSNKGSIGGHVIVDEKAAFSGKGSVGALDVHGVFVVDRLRGAPTVKGDMNLSKTAQLRYEVQADGSNDIIKVDGTAKIDGASLHVVAAGEFPQTSEFTIIEASKVEGGFANVSSDLAFMAVETQSNEKNVVLTYSRNGVNIGDLTTDENGQEFGASIEEPEIPREEQATSGPSDADMTAQNPTVVADEHPSELTPPPADSMADVAPPSTPVAPATFTPPAPARPTNAAVSALLGTNKATAAWAIEQLAAGNNANLSKATLSSVSPVSTSMLSAMRQLDNASDSLPGSYKAPQLAAGGAGSGRVWLQALGQGGKVDRDFDSSLKHATEGLILGADWRFDEHWYVGVIGGKSQTRFDARHFDGDLDSWHLGTYALRQDGPFALRLGASFSSHDGSSTRQVAFNRFSDRPKARYDASTQQAFAEVGYNLGRSNVSIEPFASLGYQRYQRDTYTEKGGAAALKVHGQTNDNFSSTLGMRLAQINGLDNGMQLTPRFSAGWKHTYGELYGHTRQRLVTGGRDYTVYGAPLDRDSLMLDAGLDLRVSANNTLGVGLTGEAGSDGRSYGVTGQWRMAF
jgi:outer membrane autotransporter protein